MQAHTNICRPLGLCHLLLLRYTIAASFWLGLDCWITAPMGTHKTLFLESHEVVEDGYYDLAQVLIGYE
ncbi:unnamed protein product [Camellia sinensis]